MSARDWASQLLARGNKINADYRRRTAITLQTLCSHTRDNQLADRLADHYTSLGGMLTNVTSLVEEVSNRSNHRRTALSSVVSQVTLAIDRHWASLSSEARSSSQDKLDTCRDIIDDACRRYNALPSKIEPTLHVLQVLSLPAVRPSLLFLRLF